MDASKGAQRSRVLENADDNMSLIKTNISKVQSHFLVPSEKLDKVTRRVIAPYAQIERRGVKEEETKEGSYLDLNRFTIFLEDTVDLDCLLYDTALILKTVTNSSGKYMLIDTNLDYTTTIGTMLTSMTILHHVALCGGRHATCCGIH